MYIQLQYDRDNDDPLFNGRVFQQTVGIIVGAKCVPLYADLFFYLNEADLVEGHLTKKKERTRNLYFLAYKFAHYADYIYPIKL